MFYEQINISIDGQDKGDPELNQEDYEKGWPENHPELLMQYFMLNKLASDLIINAITQVQEGAAQVKQAALNFICRLTSNIASSIKRNQIINEFRNKFYFENTKASNK